MLPGPAFRDLPSTRLCDLASPQGAERPACGLDATTAVCVLWHTGLTPAPAPHQPCCLVMRGSTQAPPQSLWGEGLGGQEGQLPTVLHQDCVQVSSGPSVSCRERRDS